MVTNPSAGRVPGYRLLLASSVGHRDGMALELGLEDGTQVAEVFNDDDTGRRVVNLFAENVPVEAIAWLLSEAEAQL